MLASETIAFPISRSLLLVCALLTLAPGGYTAIVRGKNNTRGVGLVEAYNLQ
jgi:hypothetical protein